MNTIMTQKAILFGAGGVGLMALDYFGVDRVECFVDNNIQKVGTKLCGKDIISYDQLLEKYANTEGYRIYISTDTFFHQLATQMNESGVNNYSFYKDFIPDYDEVKKLLSERIPAKGRIALIGTNNATELVISALEDSGQIQQVCVLFDYADSKLIDRDFYGLKVRSIEQLQLLAKSFDVIISTLPQEQTSLYFNGVLLDKQVIYAVEAIKYLSSDYLKEKKFFEEVDPDQVLSAKRMDIIPRFLFINSLIKKQKNEYYTSLYARSILLWNNADEKVGVFSARAKKSVSEHIIAVQKLLLDMQKNGFKKTDYIPMSNGILLDGAHRLAAALALNEKVWVKEVQNKPNPVSFDWFIQNGFTFKDQIEILRGFADLYKCCGIFVVFYPAIEYWDYIKKIISKKMTIVGYVDLDFTNNFYAFQNIINEIYSTYQGNLAMEEKIRLLMMMPLKLRVVLTSDEGHTTENIYAWMTQIKLEIRDYLTFDIPDEEYCTIHGTDSEEEFNSLKEVVLSYNNYCQLIRRTTPFYRNEYLERIGKLKMFCSDRKIPLKEVCVVSGSTLEAMGIRFSDDIDVIVSSRIRNWLNTHSTIKFDDEAEIISAGRMRNNNGDLIPDDDIIHDHNNYFILYGVKFCNIEVTKNQKKFSASVRDKDKRDIRLIEVFEDYSAYFDASNELKKQMKSRMPIKL